MTQSKRYIEKLKAKYSHKDKRDYYYLSHRELSYLGPGLSMGHLKDMRVAQKIQLTLASVATELKPADGHLYRVETHVATITGVEAKRVTVKIKGKGIKDLYGSSLSSRSWTYQIIHDQNLFTAWELEGPDKMYQEYWIARLIEEDRAEAIMYPAVDMEAWWVPWKI